MTNALCKALFPEEYVSETQTYQEEAFENITLHFKTITAILQQNEELFSKYLHKNNDTEEESPSEDTGSILVELASRILVPVICSIGVFGNIFTFLVLSIRLLKWKSTLEAIEVNSILGMIFLAVVDLSFCVMTLCVTLSEKSRMIHHVKDSSFYFTLYGDYFQNALIKTGTFITAIMAIYRNIVVVYPASAFRYSKSAYTIVACIGSLVFWILLYLPLLWTWKVDSFSCSTNNAVKDVILLSPTGIFEEDQAFRQSFAFTWCVIGFFLPVLILAYCNLRILRSLYISYKNLYKRENKPSVARSHQQMSISVTLVSIICFYFLLILPGEVTLFYQEVYRSKGMATGSLANVVMVCNILQAINMSFNFILYCCFNRQFTDTLNTFRAHLCRPHGPPPDVNV